MNPVADLAEVYGLVTSYVSTLTVQRM